MPEPRHLDLRGIFDNIRVPWRDKGPNTSRGNVNICCPFCNDDHGFHMAVSEDKEGAYYCYRRPQEHKGMKFTRLLEKLGVPRIDAVYLVENFAGAYQPAVVKAEPRDVEKMWERFRVLDYVDAEPHLDYLYNRGFVGPSDIAERYDIRFARNGTWAQRILLPINDVEGVIGFTGRAIRKNLDPRYLTESGGNDGLAYLPRPARAVHVHVEGPLDALKGAVATEDLPVSFSALTGKNLNFDRMSRLKRFSGVSQVQVVLLDADTVLKERLQIQCELKGLYPNSRVMVERMPEGFKDPGEMPLSALHALGGMLAGLARQRK